MVKKPPTEHSKSGAMTKIVIPVFEKTALPKEKKTNMEGQGGGLREKIQQTTGWALKVSMTTNRNSLIKEIFQFYRHDLSWVLLHQNPSFNF